jgi:hypothetical protein
MVVSVGQVIAGASFAMLITPLVTVRLTKAEFGFPTQVTTCEEAEIPPLSGGAVPAETVNDPEHTSSVK